MPQAAAAARARRHLEDEIAGLFATRLGRFERPTPLLDRALALVGAQVPASEAEIGRRLVAAGLARGPLPLAQLERAARFAATAPTFSVLRRDGFAVAVPAGRLRLAATVYGIAVRAMVNWGLALIGRIAFQAGTDDLAMTTAVLSAKHTFRWLDRPAGWFWFANEDAPLVRRIEKALRVAGTVRLDDLGQALFRRWTPDNIPSRRALHELCAQVPRFRVARGCVSLVERNGATVLTPDERSLVALFRRHGPRLEGHRLQEIATALGIAAGQLGRTLRASPLVIEPQPGVFRLIGT